jgi:hypothetical protein
LTIFGESLTELIMPVDHLTDDELVVTVWCAYCSCELRYLQSRASARPARNSVICEACERMSADGVDVQGNSELMRSLAQRNLRLHRLPGGFFRVLPRAR